MLVSQLRHAFQAHASNPAVQGQRSSWTYAELDRKSRMLAHVLVSAGVQLGDTVGLLLKRSPSLVLAEVATVRLGVAYSPLDIESPPVQLQAALTTLRPRVVLTDGSCAIPTLADCRVIDLRAVDLATRDDFDDVWCECTGDSVAYITFTSGTTGVPKGVMIPHSGISRLVCDTDFASFNAGSRFGFISSPAFDASTLEIWAPLLNGGCCVVQEKPTPSLDDLASFILGNKITDVFLTSALFCAMVEHRLDSFRELEQLLTGGERVSPHHARIFLDTYPSIRLINGYGPTENTTFTACRTITVADTESAAGIPIGSPIHGTCVRIGTEPSDAEYGELLAGGAGVAVGYLNDDALTATKFVTIAETRWYKTGDLVRRRADGILEFEGRIDRQVKLQGHRIELDAIETLLSSLPGIGQCAVFVSGDSATNRHLVAFYTILNGTRPTPTDILAFLRTNLPLHSMPRVLRAIDTMPRTANGKIDQHKLQEIHAANAGVRSAIATALSSDTEIRLGKLWRELFPSVEIHPLLNLESLGATSLQALQLSAATRREFQKFLSAIQVIRTPVLRDQAALIESLPRNIPESARAVDFTEAHALTQIQRSVLAADALDESGCAFLVHVPLLFETHAILPQLRHAFEQLAERHPALRLAIADDPGADHASVDPALRTGWLRHHGALPPSPRADTLPTEVVRLINRPLDRANDGVMRVDSWGEVNERTLIVWTIHHVAIDEASIDHCLRDLDALLGGRELPPVLGNPLSLAEFERKRTAVSAQQYWSSRILDVLGAKAPALPRAPGYGCEIEVELPIDVAQNFLVSCRTTSITPFVPLLVAYGRAMQNVFGSEYAFVATPFSRRSDPAVGDIVGCLIDLNLVEAGALPNETLTENLNRVYTTAAKLQECLFFPFERVSEEVARRQPGAERNLNSFGFTWRLAPVRDITLGGLPARLLRVAQLGARFGMTLHGWLEDGQLRCSIETLDDERARSKAQELARELMHQLPIVSGARFTPDLHQAHSDQHTEQPFSAELLEALKRRWILDTGIPASAFSEAANFWELGGNSLTALQMFAQLAQESGVRIEPAEFFALPTFANLHRLASAKRARPGSIHDVIGAPDARHCIVVFPGDHGSALGMHAIGNHLQRLLGDNFAVVIVDLLEILRCAPKAQFTTFVTSRCNQLLDELGRARIVSLVGFSSGGLTALSLAHAYKSTPVLDVWLLDTYHPETELSLLVNRTARPVVRTLLSVPLLAKLARTRVRTTLPVEPVHEYPVGSIEYVRAQARHELLQERPAAPTGTAHLIQALQTAQREFIPFRRKTNGFGTAYFKHGSILRVDCAHEELTNRYAEEIAAHIAASITSRVPSPATPQSAPPSAR